MIQFAPVQLDADSLSRYVELFAACFPTAAKFNKTYLKWLYIENPDGPAIGFDAWDDDVLAAHYVVIPACARVGGAIVRVALSLNTATHPKFQGQGLFTKLAQMTYSAACSAGVDSIYGVANANSTPGFVRKLGFQLVQPLAARIGFGPAYRAASGGGTNIPVQFERVRNADSLKWRCANPENPVYGRVNGGSHEFFAASVNKRIPAFAQIPALDASGLVLKPPPLMWPIRLFVGLLPAQVPPGGAYLDIPERFKPSPLNFIYLSLDKRVEKLEPGTIRFSFLDFDAY